VGEHNSPYFAAGLEDGQRDSDLASSCPPGQPAGMDPERAWSYMYQRGYGRTFLPSPCPCDGSCRHGKQYGEAPDGARTGG
jgi:hypothetical protein